MKDDIFQFICLVATYIFLEKDSVQGLEPLYLVLFLLMGFKCPLYIVNTNPTSDTHFTPPAEG